MHPSTRCGDQCVHTSTRGVDRCVHLRTRDGDQCVRARDLLNAKIRELAVKSQEIVQEDISVLISTCVIDV